MTRLSPGLRLCSGLINSASQSDSWRKRTRGPHVALPPRALHGSEGLPPGFLLAPPPSPAAGLHLCSLPLPWGRKSGGDQAALDTGLAVPEFCPHRPSPRTRKEKESWAWWVWSCRWLGPGSYHGPVLWGASQEIQIPWVICGFSTASKSTCPGKRNPL